MIACIDYICAVLVRILNLIFHFLPIRLTLWLGRQAGTLVYFINRDRRVIGYANLRACFCREKSPGELKKLIKGRSALIISHRYSTVKMADKIIVLDKGEIIEQGTHAQLIEKNGKYAGLYRTQAMGYKV